MIPKMTIRDAASFLGMSENQIHKMLLEYDLPFSYPQGKSKAAGLSYFGYATARKIFNINKPPKAIAFQIVKGGTGKTSIASAFAVRANLYGLKVLCIDLDQQGNLSDTFNIDAESLPVMVDILAEDYAFTDAIAKVYPGFDIITSRIENALIDDVIKLKGLPLDQVYRNPISQLKQHYDLIVIDCPPNLGQSVAAVTLAVDMVVSPVVPENFALSGLKTTHNTIRELEEAYNTNIPFGIVLNKHDARTTLSQDALQTLVNHFNYRGNMLKTYIRTSQEFPNAIANGQTIFDSVKPSIAKTDIDNLTKELLGIGQPQKHKTDKPTTRYSKLENSLA